MPSNSFLTFVIRGIAIFDRQIVNVKIDVEERENEFLLDDNEKIIVESACKSYEKENIREREVHFRASN